MLKGKPKLSAPRLDSLLFFSWLPRYDESTNELINEELGIAYPVIDGIPNMIPEAARTTRKKPPADGSKETSGPAGPQQ